MIMERMKKWVALVIIYGCNLLPIKKNKILIFSYYGSNYGCNPKYITKYIADHAPGTFDVVWAFNEPETKPDSAHMRKVKIMSFAYFYELCTAKVVITNYRTTDLFIKRKNQYYIQTWHSSLRLKQIEKDAENILPPVYVEMAKKDASKCDLLLSGCRFSTAIFRNAFWYNGEIFEHGTPRNDLLFQTDFHKRKEILEKLKIPKGNKILLYAPTFRQGNDLTVYDIDYNQLSNRLEDRYGGEWMILIKLHPHLIFVSRNLDEAENVINVTAYDDIQELLFLSDILITDYSSLMFDFAITKRPCFLYVPDLQAYTRKERKLYFNIKQLPFPYATSNLELFDNIEKSQNEAYKREVTTFLENIGSFEDGRASERLVKRLEAVCAGRKGSGVYEAV